MDNKINVATAPKTSTFQIRINPQVKEEAEYIFAKCGLTLTEAINVFLQQSINVEGLPFLIVNNGKDVLKEQAIAYLMSEIKKGEDSVSSENSWVSEEDVMKEFGVKLE